MTTYREDLQKSAMTINGDDYVPLKDVEEILDDIEDRLLGIPDLIKVLH